MKKFGMTSVQNVPLRVGLKLKDFDEDEETENWPFCELVGGLLWLAISTRECFNDWGERGYDDSVPGEVTKTIPSGDRTT